MIRHIGLGNVGLTDEQNLFGSVRAELGAPLRSADLIFIAHPKSRVIINILKLSV